MMTVYQEIVEALASDPEIAISYGSMSRGDLSILVALLDNDVGVGTTITGSANAQFWRCLSEYGWMEKEEAPFPEAPMPMMHYRITDRGFRAVPALLCKLSAE